VLDVTAHEMRVLREVTGLDWIVDFPIGMSGSEALRYQCPFEDVRAHVYEERQSHRTPLLKERWWLHERPRPDMRRALNPLRRYLATPEVAKHRPFHWLTPEVLPDHQLIVFASDEDFMFGLLHSNLHEVWARAKGSQLREAESGFRYTPTSVFETFPFPERQGQRERIAAAARELDRVRGLWLNPAEWLRSSSRSSARRWRTTSAAAGTLPLDF
jgi:hypothetical protein